MPLVTTSDLPLRALYTGLNVAFQEQYTAALEQGARTRVATEVPSNAESEDYAFLGAVPGVREFLGERQFRDLAGYSYNIKNKEWENSIAVKRADIEHDKLGLIRMRVQDMAVRAAQYQDQLTFETLANGFSQTCYDGQYFFDTDHAGSSGNQSNKGTSALSAASLQAAITAMMKFEDDQGNVLGVAPDTLVVPPDLKWTAMELLNSTYNVNTASSNTPMMTNVLQGALDLVVSPYLKDTNNWYVLCTRGVMKPLIYQMDTPVEFKALENNSEVEFMRAQYLYGTYARYNVGYGLWQFAYGSQVS